MQTDPIGYKDGMNWYAYVGNEPVNITDPSGECGGGWCIVGGGIIIAYYTFSEIISDATDSAAEAAEAEERALECVLGERVGCTDEESDASDKRKEAIRDMREVGETAIKLPGTFSGGPLPTSIPNNIDNANTLMGFLRDLFGSDDDDENNDDLKQKNTNTDKCPEGLTEYADTCIY